MHDCHTLQDVNLHWAIKWQFSNVVNVPLFIVVNLINYKEVSPEKTAADSELDYKPQLRNQFKSFHKIKYFGYILQFNLNLRK